MEFVTFLFELFWFFGFISGLAAAAGIFALKKHAVEAPLLLKLSGLSILFAKYYPNHNRQRKVTLILELVCIICIFLGFAVIFIGMPEAREILIKKMAVGGV